MAKMEKEQARVLSQEMLAAGIYSMWIQTKAAKNAKPGQFISMYTNDAGKLLPRPISICEIDRESEKLRVVYRVTGENTGTEQFSKLQAGDTIDIVGSLGNGFPLEKAKGKKVWVEESECRRSYSLLRKWNVKRSGSLSVTGMRRHF